MDTIVKFINNKKGSFSILFVIISFIALITATAFIDILKQSYVLTEVQGIMDTAGVSALNASVDKEKLRGEEFHYNEDTLMGVYYEIINQRVHTGDIISYKKLLRAKITHDNNNFGLGANSRPSDQLWLDSVLLVRVKTSPIFDLAPGLQKRFYDSKSNGNFKITVNGQTEDGKTELMIRSVSRLVYR